jgi:hypothetical protein
MSPPILWDPGLGLGLDPLFLAVSILIGGVAWGAVLYRRRMRRPTFPAPAPAPSLLEDHMGPAVPHSALRVEHHGGVPIHLSGEGPYLAEIHDLPRNI